VRYVEVFVSLTWGNDGGSGLNDVFIDNINVQGTQIVEEVDRKLYRITNPASSPSWADVTPTNKELPNTPYGLAVDVGSNNNLSMSAVDVDGYRYYLSSTGAGSPWVRRGRTQYTGLKRNGNLMILFGFNRIALSNDAGLTPWARNGNWAQAVGPVGEIRSVIAIL